MTQETFQQKTWDMAGGRVRQKIDAFKRNVYAEWLKLGIPAEEEGKNGIERWDNCKDILLNAITSSMGYRAEWPKRLWSAEHEKVKTEVLANLDIVQQMLLAPKQPDNLITDGTPMT
jgi:hypothetical protein